MPPTMRWIALTAALSLVACGSETDPPEAPLGDEFDVDAGSVRLHVNTYGSQDAARVVVLLHGGPGLSSAYMRAFEALASDSVRVVRYDQRGVGNSTSPVPPSFTIDDYAHDLEAIRKRMGDPRFELIAHGWGALIAWSYLTLYPAGVGSMVFVDGWAPNAKLNHDAFERARDQITFLQQSGLIPNPLPPDNGDDCSPGFVAQLPAYMFNPQAALPNELTSQPCRRSVEVQTLDAVFSVPFDYGAVGAGFTGRSLVIFGNNDPHGNDLATGTVAALPASAPELQVKPSAGHYAWFETDVMSEVAAFLAALP